MPPPRSAARRPALRGQSSASPQTLASILRLLGRHCGQAVAIALLVSGIVTLAVAGLWMGLVLVLRPQPPAWLVNWVPAWGKVWSSLPVETLAEIDQALKGAGFHRGDLIALKSADAPKTELYLLPIYAPWANCAQGCEAITELRLYRLHHREDTHLHLQLLQSLNVIGPIETDLLPRTTEGDLSLLGSTQTLPLTDLKSLQAPDLPGYWFSLTGRWQNQGSPVLYGQVLHVNPQTTTLESVLPWKSPAGRLPTWINADQQGSPELVVNESAGLEPHYRLYTIAHRTAAHQATHLEEVTLVPLALPADLPAEPYQTLLFLAQQGLWSEAERRLTTWTAHKTAPLPADLEQQRQLITLHAHYSQNQAQRNWAQPSQHLLALLLDGQWQAAMAKVKGASQEDTQAVLPLLNRNSNRLWQRLTAALEVAPQQQDARLWGALLLLAKQDEKTALQWLTPHPQAPIRKEFEAIAAHLGRPLASAQSSPPRPPFPTITVTSPPN